MGRRRTTSRTPAKAQQTSKAKKKPARNRRHSVSKDTEVTRLARELREAREQQAATLEVLKIISSSPGDLTPVFDAILERATQLCEATHGHVWRFDGEQLYAVAVRGDPQSSDGCGSTVPSGRLQGVRQNGSCEASASSM